MRIQWSAGYEGGEGCHHVPHRGAPGIVVLVLHTLLGEGQQGGGGLGREVERVRQQQPRHPCHVVPRRGGIPTHTPSQDWQFCGCEAHRGKASQKKIRIGNLNIN